MVKYACIVRHSLTQDTYIVELTLQRLSVHRMKNRTVRCHNTTAGSTLTLPT